MKNHLGNITVSMKVSISHNEEMSEEGLYNGYKCHEFHAKTSLTHACFEIFFVLISICVSIYWVYKAFAICDVVFAKTVKS